MPFASPVDREGIDGGSVRVALGGEVVLDLVMIRGGEQVEQVEQVEDDGTLILASGDEMNHTRCSVGNGKTAVKVWS